MFPAADEESVADLLSVSVGTLVGVILVVLAILVVGLVVSCDEEAQRLQHNQDSESKIEMVGEV